ncbi:MAG: hypothetical protein U1A22_10045 [Xanthomonadaceae bacterium]|nr:hypothetical protein [Xanthomonadaceae bacterium]
MSRSFWQELKRRHVYRGAVMYIVAAWVLVQVATQVFPFFDIPDWAVRLVVVVALLGFPVALVLLWMFDIVPTDDEGNVIEPGHSGEQSAAVVERMMKAEREARRKENEALIAALTHHRHGQVPPSPVVVRAQAAESPNAHLTGSAGPPAPEPSPASKRGRSIRNAVFAFLALLIVMSGVWVLVAPPAAFAPSVAGGELIKDVSLPGFDQVEAMAVKLLAPVLTKLGIPIAPERVFTLILVIVALLVIRDFFRMVGRSRSRRLARG